MLLFVDDDEGCLCLLDREEGARFLAEDFLALLLLDRWDFNFCCCAKIRWACSLRLRSFSV